MCTNDVALFGSHFARYLRARVCFLLAVNQLDQWESLKNASMLEYVFSSSLDLLTYQLLIGQNIFENNVTTAVATNNTNLDELLKSLNVGIFEMWQFLFQFCHQIKRLMFTAIIFFFLLLYQRSSMNQSPFASSFYTRFRSYSCTRTFTHTHTNCVHLFLALFLKFMNSAQFYSERQISCIFRVICHLFNWSISNSVRQKRCE